MHIRTLEALRRTLAGSNMTLKAIGDDKRPDREKNRRYHQEMVDQVTDDLRRWRDSGDWPEQ